MKHLFKKGNLNPNWVGGKTITSHKYILRLVGVGHHLADIRGYAYEHRIVAELKYNRLLKKEEHVHHVDGNTLNNSPENLVIKKDLAHHFISHRKSGSNLKLPNEENTLIQCECGCKEYFLKFDSVGRPRKFIVGHNPAPTPLMDAITGCFKENETLRTTEIINRVKKGKTIKSCLAKMLLNGRLIKVGHGKYKLTI